MVFPFYLLCLCGALEMSLSPLSSSQASHSLYHPCPASHLHSDEGVRGCSGPQILEVDRSTHVAGPSYNEFMPGCHVFRTQDNRGSCLEPLRPSASFSAVLSFPSDAQREQARLAVPSLRLVLEHPCFSLTSLTGRVICVEDYGRFSDDPSLSSVRVFMGDASWIMGIMKLSKKNEDPAVNRRNGLAWKRELDVIHRLNAADPLDTLPFIRLIASFAYTPGQYGSIRKVGLQSLDERLRIAPELYCLQFARSIAQALTKAYIALEGIGGCHIYPTAHDLLWDRLDRKWRIFRFDFSLDSTHFIHANQNSQRPYMAPELCLCDDADHHPADTWRIACLLFKAATGEVLFPARTDLELIAMVIQLLGPVPGCYPIKEQWEDCFQPCPDKESGYVLKEQERLLAPFIHRKDFIYHHLQRIQINNPPEEYAQFEDLFYKLLLFNHHDRLVLAEMQFHPFISSAR